MEVCTNKCNSNQTQPYCSCAFWDIILVWNEKFILNNLCHQWKLKIAYDIKNDNLKNGVKRNLPYQIINAWLRFLNRMRGDTESKLHALLDVKCGFLTSPVRNSQPENVLLFLWMLLLWIICGMNRKKMVVTKMTMFRRNSQRSNTKYDWTPDPNIPVRKKNIQLILS